MAIKSTVELEVKSNLKGFKGEIREATIEAQEAVRTFGEFSPEAVKAEKRLAALRDRMEDFNDRVAAVNPDKFAQVQTVVNGVARGFQAAQGAAALFGNESEDLQKTMVKLQGAMALADGLEGLGKMQQQFGAIAGNIKGNVVKAFSTLRGAIIATGLGALAVGVGLVIANFDSLKKVILNLIPGLGSMATFVGGLVQKFTDWVGITSAQDRALDKLNKTTGKTNEQLDREIALLQARGDQVGVFNKQRQKLENDLAQARANYGKNTEKEWGKIILDTKNALEILKIEEKKFNDDRIKAAADAEAARLKAIKDKKEQAAKELEAENEKNKKHEQELQDELFNIKGAGIVKNAEQLKAQTAKDIADQLILNEQEAANRKAISDKATADQLANDAAIKQSKQDLYASSVDLANAVIALAGEQNRTGKALALGVIAADTAMALTGALKVSQSPSADNVATGGLAGAAKYVALAAMILNNAKRARDILKGGGQPSVSAQGLSPQFAAPQTSSSLLQNGGGEQLTQQSRVYVLEGDITRTQQRVSNNKNVSVVK